MAKNNVGQTKLGHDNIENEEMQKLNRFNNRTDNEGGLKKKVSTSYFFVKLTIMLL